MGGIGQSNSVPGVGICDGTPPFVWGDDSVSKVLSTQT